MSKKAVAMVKQRLEDQPESEEVAVDFDETVELLAEELGVAEKTAASYIYDAVELTHEWSADGNEHLVREARPSDANKNTVLQQYSGDPLKMESGGPNGETFEHLEVLTDNGHPLVPDETTYYRRRLEGHKTDVQVVTYDLSRDSPGGRQNVLLTGLPGVGKNQLAEHIAAKTNWPTVRIPVGGGIRYEDLVGHYEPVPDGEGGFSLEWTDGILTTAVRNGFLVVLDEINMMTGDVSSPLHQITEDDDSRHLTIRQTGEVIEPHPNFGVVATRNPNFAGANEMNRAFLSRFVEHEVGFLDKSAEVRVLTNDVEGLEEDDIEPVVEYANEVRDRYPQELDLIVTTRDLKRIGGYVAGGLFDTKHAIRKVILPRADPETDRGALEDEIDLEF